MLKVNIPGRGELTFTDVMLDYNGTLALDGFLIKGVRERLAELSSHFILHIVTGDSHGTAKTQLAHIKCKLTILPAENQATGKLDYLKRLNQSHTIAIGNGNNDQYMLKEAQIGIIVSGTEGTSAISLAAADILMPNILDALDLLKNPRRLSATLRF
jgi:P-type E1-E2 ATPase